MRDAEGRLQANRLWKVVYPGNRVEEFGYDLAGRLALRIDRRGVWTHFSYDGLGRLKSRTYTNITPPVTATPAVTFTYDGTCPSGMSQRGRLSSASTPETSLTWCYDLAGQVRTAAQGDGTITRTVSYEYDDAGNRTRLSLDSEAEILYSWEDRGLLRTLTGPGGIFTFEHDGASRRDSLLHPNGVFTDYTYDTRSRLASLLATRAGSTVAHFTYPTHDKLDNRTSRGGATAPAETYGYDELYRLLTVMQGAVTTESYTYDAVGNRETSSGGPAWTYSDRNELLTTPTASFAYDLNGNLTQKVEGGLTWTYEWDAENRLTRTLKNGTPVATYTYDPLGRRIERTVVVIPGVDAQEHSYLYDGEDILREGFSNPFIEGPITETGRHIYVHGPGIDEPLAVEHANHQVWLAHADGLGSIVRVTGQGGSVVQSRQYDSFGNLQLGGTEEGYAFTGREWDPETGLYYYRARYYDPKIGRFISEDPITPGSRMLANQVYDLSEYELEYDEEHRGSSAGIWPEDLNLYTYVYNSPPNLTDPSGEHPAARAAAAAARAAWKRWGAPAAKWAWTKTKQAWQNVDFDGPQRGGRICQIRWKKRPVCRLDYHPIAGSHGKNRLHVNIGSGHTQIRLDPRCFLD